MCENFKVPNESNLLTEQKDVHNIRSTPTVGMVTFTKTKADTNYYFIVLSLKNKNNTKFNKIQTIQNYLLLHENPGKKTDKTTATTSIYTFLYTIGYANASFARFSLLLSLRFCTLYNFHNATNLNSENRTFLSLYIANLAQVQLCYSPSGPRPAGNFRGNRN